MIFADMITYAQDFHWTVWLAVAIFLIFTEVITLTFVFALVTIGALIAGAIAFMNATVTVQIALISTAAILSLVFFRKSAINRFKGLKRRSSAHTP